MKRGAEPPTVYLYDFDGNLAAEADGDTGTTLREYLYSGSSRLAMADPATGAVYFFHNDQLGTPELMTDSTNTVVWEASYDAFGEAAVNPASTVTNNFRFPGQYYDAETGLHYNWHRYYDPKTGRYLTPDPIGFAGGINPYVYVYRLRGQTYTFHFSEINRKQPAEVSVGAGEVDCRFCEYCNSSLLRKRSTFIPVRQGAVFHELP